MTKKIHNIKKIHSENMAVLFVVGNLKKTSQIIIVENAVFYSDSIILRCELKLTIFILNQVTKTMFLL